MKTLDDLVWHRKFIARCMNISYTASDIKSFLDNAGVNYSLEDIKSSMERVK